MRRAEFSVGADRLHGEVRLPAVAKAALVLVHGFNSSRPEFGGLPDALEQAGYAVLAFDQRGYGESEGDPGLTSVERAVADIDAAARFLRAKVPAAPMGIVGHSLGGAYALAALGRTDHFRAGVVAHPVDCLFNELRPWEKWGYHVLGRRNEARMRKGRPSSTIPYKLAYDDLFVSKEAARAARADGFLLGRVSLANYRPAMTMSARAWAKEVRQPVLVVASPFDRALKPGGVRAVHDALAGPKAWLEHRGGHSCFRDVDGAMLAQATVGWFDGHLVP